jgi:hypothetical protein
MWYRDDSAPTWDITCADDIFAALERIQMADAQSTSFSAE